MEKKAKNGYRKKNLICVYFVIGFGNILKTIYLLITSMISQKWVASNILVDNVNDELLAHLHPNGILKNDKGSRHKTIPSIM